MLVIEGCVIEGRKMGRKLGFPTANVAIDSDLQIEGGVYLSRVVIEGVGYDAVTNIGTNPTVGDVRRRSESYIFDFDGDIYGRKVRVELLVKLRSEIRFESLEALTHQIQKDVDMALQLR